MFDPDPSARILRLGDQLPSEADRPAAQPVKQFHRLFDGFKRPAEATDRQHLARVAQADPIAGRHSVGDAIVRLRAVNEMHDSLAQHIAEL